MLNANRAQENLKFFAAVSRIYYLTPESISDNKFKLMREGEMR